MLRLDTISLYYFTEAAKDLNFTQTANRLFLSQQNLSSHIARLESKCGCKLFQRKPKVQLTYEGELFLAYAKEAVASESNILSVLKAVADEDSGRLHIGISTPRAAIFIPEILRDCTKTYPGGQRYGFLRGGVSVPESGAAGDPSADRRPVPVHVGRPAPDVCSGPGGGPAPHRTGWDYHGGVSRTAGGPPLGRNSFVPGDSVLL